MLTAQYKKQVFPQTPCSVEKPVESVENLGLSTAKTPATPGLAPVYPPIPVGKPQIFPPFSFPAVAFFRGVIYG